MVMVTEVAVGIVDGADASREWAHWRIRGFLGVGWQLISFPTGMALGTTPQEGE